MTDRRAHRRVHLWLVLLALVGSILVAGCGSGPSKDEYESGLRKVQAELGKANDASRASGAATDAEDRRAALEKAHGHIAKAATLATGLEPPDDASDAHKQLASALRDYATLFGKLAKLKPGDADESQLYGDAGSIVERLTDANRALAKAGYKVKTGDAS